MHLALLIDNDELSVCFNPGQSTAPRDLMLKNYMVEVVEKQLPLKNR